MKWKVKVIATLLMVILVVSVINTGIIMRACAKKLQCKGKMNQLSYSFQLEDIQTGTETNSPCVKWREKCISKLILSADEQQGEGRDKLNSALSSENDIQKLFNCPVSPNRSSCNYISIFNDKESLLNDKIIKSINRDILLICNYLAFCSKRPISLLTLYY